MAAKKSWSFCFLKKKSFLSFFLVSVALLWRNNSIVNFWNGERDANKQKKIFFSQKRKQQRQQQEQACGRIFGRRDTSRVDFHWPPLCLHLGGYLLYFTLKDLAWDFLTKLLPSRQLSSVALPLMSIGRPTITRFDTVRFHSSSTWTSQAVSLPSPYYVHAKYMPLVHFAVFVSDILVLKWKSSFFTPRWFYIYHNSGFSQNRPEVVEED